MSSTADTQRKVLDAATEEFALHGIAGARVDRIAAASGMSKPVLYTYFGSKDGLFEAVFHDRVIGNLDRAPFDAADLPGYAQAQYDDYLADPFLLRLVLWKRLEKMPHGFLFEGLEEGNGARIAAIRGQQEAHRIRADLDPEDIWHLLLGIAATWAQTALITVATVDDGQEEHRHRREALAAVVRSGFCVVAS